MGSLRFDGYYIYDNEEEKSFDHLLFFEDGQVLHASVSDTVSVQVFKWLNRGGLADRNRAKGRYSLEGDTIEFWTLRTVGGDVKLQFQGAIEGEQICGELTSSFVDDVFPRTYVFHDRQSIARREKEIREAKKAARKAKQKPELKPNEGEVNRELLAAICNAPDDDDLRLKYADWVEARDPARAEFIRVQIELAGLRHDGSAGEAIFDHLDDECDSRILNWLDWESIDAGVARRHTLKKRQNYLWGRNRKRWRANEAVSKMGISTLEMDRGFFASGKLLGTKSLLEHANELFQRAPIEHLEKDDLTTEHVEALIETGALRRLKSLEVSAKMRHVADKPTHYDDIWGLMSGSPDVGNIEEFGRRGPPPNKLANSTHWKSVRRTWLSADDAAVFFQAEHLKGLSHLTAVGCFSGEGVNHLAKSGFNNLRSLRFDSPLDDDSIKTLGTATCLNRLRTLWMDQGPAYGRTHTEVSAVAFQSLIASPSLNKLAVLSMPSALIGRLESDSMAKLPGTSIRVLGLSMNLSLTKTNVPMNNRIGGLSHCPSFRKVAVLSLAGRKMSNETIREFIAGDQFVELQSLDLRYCDLSDESIQMLANWPCMSKVRVLHLAGNPFGEAGANALAESPYLGNLVHLCAGGGPPDSNVSEPAKEIVRAAFKKSFEDSDGD